MQWWVAGLLASIVGYSAYNYGYQNGMSAAPELAAQRQAEQQSAVIRERLRVEAIRRSSPTPEACLPIVLDGSIDLDGFCREYLSEQDNEIGEFYDEMNQYREQDVGR